MPLSITALTIIVAAGPATVAAIVTAYLFVSRKGEVRGIEGDTVSIRPPARTVGHAKVLESAGRHRND